MKNYMKKSMLIAWMMFLLPIIVAAQNSNTSESLVDITSSISELKTEAKFLESDIDEIIKNFIKNSNITINNETGIQITELNRVTISTNTQLNSDLQEIFIETEPTNSALISDLNTIILNGLDKIASDLETVSGVMVDSSEVKGTNRDRPVI